MANVHDTPEGRAALEEAVTQFLQAAARQREFVRDLMGLLNHFSPSADPSVDRRPRIFVCQGCGRTATLLYGRKMLCECGTTSAAEILTP